MVVACTDDETEEECECGGDSSLRMGWMVGRDQRQNRANPCLHALALLPRDGPQSIMACG